MIEKTITSIFLVPTLKITRENLHINGFVNGYSDLKEKEIFYKDNDVVYLLFKPSNIELFKDFLDKEYVRTEQIIEDYNVTDDYIILVYKLQKEFKKDFKLVQQGYYSNTSKKFKKLFPEKVIDFKYPDKPKEISLQHMIFTKSVLLIDFWQKTLETSLILNNNLEVWPSYDIKKETLNLKNLKT